MAINKRLKLAIEEIKVRNKISELFQIEIIGDCEETLNDSIMYAGGGDENDEMYTIPLLPISAQGGSLNDFLVSVKDSDCERVDFS